MTKNSVNRNLLNNIIFYTALVGLVGTGTAIIAYHIARKNTRHKIIELTNAIKQNNDDRFIYMTKGSEFIQNKRMKHSIDSLKARNAELVTQDNADEIARNQRKIDSLKNCMDGNGFIIGNRLAKFNLVNDSLNVLLEQTREKLK